VAIVAANMILRAQLNPVFAKTDHGARDVTAASTNRKVFALSILIAVQA